MLDIAPWATEGRGGRLLSPAELSARFHQQLLDDDDKEVQQFALGLVERTGDSAGLCDDIIAPAMHGLGTSGPKAGFVSFASMPPHSVRRQAVSHVRSHATALLANAPIALCAALAGDPYSLPPAMCGLVLSSAGFRVTVLGANTPAQEILDAAVDLSATLLTISVSTAPTSIGELARTCEEASELGIRVALGGRMLTPELRKQLTPDFFGDSMTHLASYAKRLINPSTRVVGRS